MENENMNQEVMETEEIVVPIEENEEEIYEPSLGESLATLAIMAAPLAISYVAGVVSGDKVKAGLAKTKDKVNTFIANHKNKKKAVEKDVIDTEVVDIEEPEE